MNLNLNRPIVFFDLETTGLNVGHDHIVEICLHKVFPDTHTETRTYRVRPVDSEGNTLPIPPETTAIHGISDSDVADMPSFKELAPQLVEFIGDSDLAGYNSNKFDIPMLVEEFLRADVPFSLKDRFKVDVQNIFHRMESRTLKAAYRFYCDKDLVNAHSADADTIATYEVLMAQLDRYQDVEYEYKGEVSKPVVNDIEALSRFSDNGNWADLVGHLSYNEAHEVVFNFGKHKGKTVVSVFTDEPSYYDWMMKADFPLSTKSFLTEMYNPIELKRKEDALRRKNAQQRQPQYSLDDLVNKFNTKDK